jgi:hypothetical protein
MKILTNKLIMGFDELGYNHKSESNSTKHEFIFIKNKKNKLIVKLINNYELYVWLIDFYIVLPDENLVFASTINPPFYSRFYIKDILKS